MKNGQSAPLQARLYRLLDLEGCMDETRTVKTPGAQPPGAQGSETPPRERRPFTPPTLQELGELKELTQQIISGGG